MHKHLWRRLLLGSMLLMSAGLALADDTPEALLEQGYAHLKTGTLIAGTAPGADAVSVCLQLDSLIPVPAEAVRFCNDTASALALRAATSLGKDQLDLTELLLSMAIDVAQAPDIKNRIAGIQARLDTLRQLEPKAP